MRPRIETKPGERFGKLTAISVGEDYISPSGAKAERWVYKCDCGGSVLERPAQVRYHDRTGIAACRDCFMKWREAGGEHVPRELRSKTNKTRASGVSIEGLNETRDLVGPILKELNTLDGVKVMRNAVGLVVPYARRGATPFKAGLGAGSADIIGLVDGRFFALEVKIPGGVVAEDQQKWLDEIREIGGYAVVVTSVQEAIDAVRDARQGPAAR